MFIISNKFFRSAFLHQKGLQKTLQCFCFANFDRIFDRFRDKFSIHVLQIYKNHHAFSWYINHFPTKNHMLKMKALYTLLFGIRTDSVGTLGRRTVRWDRPGTKISGTAKSEALSSMGRIVSFQDSPGILGLKSQEQK